MYCHYVSVCTLNKIIAVLLYLSLSITGALFYVHTLKPTTVRSQSLCVTYMYMYTQLFI